MNQMPFIDYFYIDLKIDKNLKCFLIQYMCYGNKRFKE